MITYSMINTNIPYNFSVIVNKQRYTLYIRYNIKLDQYYVDINKVTVNGSTPLLRSIPLVCAADLLWQYKYMNLGSLAIYQLWPGVTNSDPNSNTLKGNFVMAWEHD